MTIEERLLQSLKDPSVDKKALFEDIEVAAIMANHIHRVLIGDPDYMDFLKRYAIQEIEPIVNGTVGTTRQDGEIFARDLALATTAWADGFALGMTIIGLQEKEGSVNGNSQDR